MFKTQGKSPAKSMPFNHREAVDEAAVGCAGFSHSLFLFSSFAPLVSFLLVASYFARPFLAHLMALAFTGCLS